MITYIDVLGSILKMINIMLGFSSHEMFEVQTLNFDKFILIYEKACRSILKIMTNVAYGRQKFIHHPNIRFD